MPFALEQLTQVLAIADKLDPASESAGTVNSTGIDASKFRRILYEVQIGNVTATGTLTLSLQSAAASNFATPHTITGSALPAQSTSNTRATLEVMADTIAQQNPGDRYVRLVAVVANAAIIYGATGWGGEAAEKPASNNNIAAVAAQVSL
jgi:hypothetical protein